MVPHPDIAIAKWLEALLPIETQEVPWRESFGRVLAQPIVADRDNPPYDVSAMDGFAVRLSDLNQQHVSVAGEVPTGHAPPDLPEGCAMRIFTGGCLPPQAEAVIKREDTAETRELFELKVDPRAIRPGQHIRRRGENKKQGEVVVEPGVLVSPGVVSAATSFGATPLSVYRKLRVGMLITGDELLAPEDQPEPWQLRDSNGPTLSALLHILPWLVVTRQLSGEDCPEKLTAQMRDLLDTCDAVITTGGVSMGDHDYIPAVLRNTGCTTAFHRLPIRPGKPMLAGVGPGGQAVIGLPGNPVSALATLRRFGLPALRRLAGFREAFETPAAVSIEQYDGKTLGLWWYRLVKLAAPGKAQWVKSMGSGDLASIAQSDGLVEVPPDTVPQGPLPFYPWAIG